MTITVKLTLAPAQEAWLHAHIARGDFDSLEGAAQQLIAERIAERAAEEGKREVLPVGALNDADLEAIAATEMSVRHLPLDYELK